jgi:hypothetical protein
MFDRYSKIHLKMRQQSPKRIQSLIKFINSSKDLVLFDLGEGVLEVVKSSGTLGHSCNGEVILAAGQELKYYWENEI